MNSSQFEKKQLQKLSFLLKCQPEEILKITSNLKRHYGHNIVTKPDKTTGLPKTYLDGTVKTRPINPAYGRLDELQKRIKNEIFRKLQFPDHINGGVMGKSNISNAKPHQGNKFIFTTDLSNCFPSITNQMVYSAFLGLGFSNVESRWLTKLTTYKYRLPQGTSTSPYLANLCLLPLDEDLLVISEELKLKYTRFIDDLTFSAPYDFGSSIERILSTISSHGLKVSRRKTIYSGQQNITGIDVFNNYIDAPDRLKERAKLETANSKPISAYVGRIRSTNKGLKSGA